MLQTVDVLIGFSLVMLVLSIVVTMLVQFVISMLLNLKGRVLKEGVAHLLNLLDKDGLTANETKQIAKHLLTNALVARKRVFGGLIGRKFALAHTIHREELIKLILDFAGNCDLVKADVVAKAATDHKTKLDGLGNLQLTKSLTDQQEKEKKKLEKDGPDYKLEDRKSTRLNSSHG